jgi:hypothetical protein
MQSGGRPAAGPGTMTFLYGKRAIICRGREIKGLRGGVHRYAAQARPQIEATTAEKGRFRMKTSS